MPTYTEEDITPDVAKEFLTHNKMNRKIRRKKVRAWADMMRNGQWVGLNGHPMAVFDINGDQTDGQHRMMAIQESGVTIRGMVSRDVQPEARNTVDEGIKRLFSDDLEMTGVRNSYVNASLFRKILAWDANEGLAAVNGTSFPRPVMNQAWPKYAQEVLDTVQHANRWSARWPGNKGALHFMYWLLVYRNQNNMELVNKFFSILTDGSQDEADKLLINVREHLAGHVAKYKQERGQLGVAYQVFWMIRGWNGWLRGDKLTRLALPKGGMSDPFPKLLHARG